ncbi:MAG: lytic transglycosylase domain-containing protein [Pseudomonadota bacterium]
MLKPPVLKSLLLLIAITGLSAAPSKSEAQLAMAPAHPIPKPEILPPLNGSQVFHYRKQFQLIRKGGARPKTSRSHPHFDPLAELLVSWAYVLEQGPNARFSDLARVLNAAETFPHATLLTRRAESRMPLSLTPEVRARWFAKHPPVSGAGNIQKAIGLLGENPRDEVAVALLRKGWRSANFIVSVEREVIRRYGHLLRSRDHEARADFKLWYKNSYAAARVMGYARKDYRKLIAARVKLQRSEAGVDTAIAAVPKVLQNNPGLIYDRAVWRRNRGKHEGVRKLLLKPDLPVAENPRPDRWWREFHLQARKALREGKYLEAYRLAAQHHLIAPDQDIQALSQKHLQALVDAEWLSGWIALRFLQQPERAITHFDRVAPAVKTDVSCSRIAYWQGRARAATKAAGADAFSYYEAAAKYPNRFYGQLALEELKFSPGRTSPLPVAQPAPYAGRQAENNAVRPNNWEMSPLIQAAMILHQLGEDRWLKPFIRHIARHGDLIADDPKVLALGKVLGRQDLGYQIAKRAQQLQMLSWQADAAYPLITPVSKALVLQGDAIQQTAIVHGIIRQESAFETTARSRAGALGLMQLLPSTAKITARRIGVPYDRARLTRDPVYNLQLGQAYFGKLQRMFEGSHILPIASYNAGENAVARWVRQYGDPRTPAVDPLDWMELIPYSETRNYVQRVLEAASVYRYRLARDQSREDPTRAQLVPLISRRAS